MSEISLRDLHQRSVAISLTINQRATTITGVGRYRVHSEFGPCLIVACRDEVGDFEFVLRDQDWVTTIVPSPCSDTADFTINLESALDG